MWSFIWHRLVKFQYQLFALDNQTMASVENLLKLSLKYSSFVICRLCLALTSTSPPRTQNHP